MVREGYQLGEVGGGRVGKVVFVVTGKVALVGEKDFPEINTFKHTCGCI